MTTQLAPRPSPVEGNTSPVPRPGLRSRLAARPITTSFAALGICLILRLIDIYVLRLDEKWGEIFLSKSLGFAVVVITAFILWGNLRAIGITRSRFGSALLLGSGISLGVYAIAYGGEYLITSAAGQDPHLWISAIDSKQGVTGGLLFGVWLVLGNVVNALMEEGLFRGVFLPAFMGRFSFWTANLLQSLLFGLWHAVWPVKAVLTGEISVMGGVMSGLLLFTGSFINGLFWGYLHHRTGSLWTAFFAHFAANSIQNIVHVVTPAGTDMTASIRGIVAGVLTTAILGAAVLVLRRRPAPPLGYPAGIPETVAAPTVAASADR
jgi:membrane protease YdiL (CAAX protease family)